MRQKRQSFTTAAKEIIVNAMQVKIIVVVDIVHNL